MTATRLLQSLLEPTGFNKIRKRLNNQNERDEFVRTQLSKLAEKSLLLDAGCGSQRHRKDCGHLRYRAQDFGQYTTDVKQMIGCIGAGGDEGYKYGKLDYVGNIWEIEERNETFDAILCTEVLEHIPYPIETIHEFSRLLKAGGTLILTAPSNCLRHMDPYFYSSGFSDRWYEVVLTGHGFKIEELQAVGDYYSWLAVELARTAKANSILAKILLAPAFLYYFNKKKTQLSIDTLCMGYHVVARKLPPP
jgi:SAM-dependent methyltransferase